MDYWPQIIPAVSGLVGTAVGGLITFFTQRAFRSEDAMKEQKGLALALASEIDAFCDLMFMRNHAANAKSLAQVAAAGQAVVIKNWITEYEKGREIFPILKANLGHIGRLGPICGDISNFYAHVSAVRTTVIAFQDGNYAALKPEVQAQIAIQEIGIWDNALKKGKWIAQELRRENS